METVYLVIGKLIFWGSAWMILGTLLTLAIDLLDGALVDLVGSWREWWASRLLDAITSIIMRTVQPYEDILGMWLFRAFAPMFGLPIVLGLLIEFALARRLHGDSAATPQRSAA